jgi:hypothetical protein
MRDFFKKEVLDRTYEIFGVRQTDEDKMSDEDIKFLLDGLCQVSKNYAYIPEAEQKKIISACMISDKTYRNINLRLVAGWLEQNGKKYFTEVAHIPTEITKPPLTGQARDKAIQEYLDAIARAETNFTSAMTEGRGAKMREQLDKAGVKFDESKDERYNPVKSFIVDGIEIYAKSQEEAEMFAQGFQSQQPIEDIEAQNKVDN